MTMPPLHGLDILVAEDRYFVATELAQMLQKLGAAVVGPVGRLPLDRSLVGRTVHVALLDVELGGGTCFPLADELAARGVPVALITGFARNVLPPPYCDLPRLDKPVERSKLAAAVLSLAGRGVGVAA